MSDWKSLFPFVGEKTVARRLNAMFDRKSVVSGLFGAMVGGFVTTLIALLSPTLIVALMWWAVGLAAVPLLSIYWGILQKKWEEATDES